MQVCFHPLLIITSHIQLTILHLRQIPYAIGQFTVNEFCHELVLRSVTDETRRTISQSSPLRFGITLGCGIIAGFAAAILSHVGALSLSLSYFPWSQHILASRYPSLTNK